MKTTHIIILVALAVTFGVLISMSSDYSSYSNFSEAKSSLNKEFHIAGTYNKEAGIDFAPEQDANVFGFTMEDTEGKEMYVLVNGDKPKEFEMSEQVVVIGKAALNGADTTFYASDMLLKCPSKYVDEEIAVK